MFFTPVIKRLSPRWNLEKTGGPHWNRVFSAWSLVFGLILQLDSRDFVLIVPQYVISSFSSNTWKLLSFLKPITISSKTRYEYPWTKITNLMTGHRLQNYTLCFNRANDRAKFDYWGGRKTLLFFRLHSFMTSKEIP